MTTYKYILERIYQVAVGAMMVNPFDLVITYEVTEELKELWNLIMNCYQDNQLDAGEVDKLMDARRMVLYDVVYRRGNDVLKEDCELIERMMNAEGGGA